MHFSTAAKQADRNAVDSFMIILSLTKILMQYYQKYGKLKYIQTIMRFNIGNISLYFHIPEFLNQIRHVLVLIFAILLMNWFHNLD